MAESTLAAVKTGTESPPSIVSSRCRRSTTSRPLMKVEVAGICGSDVKNYKNTLENVIMGHENVGRIWKAGKKWLSARAQGRRPRVPRALPAVHEVRVVPSGRVPPLHRDRLAPQSGRDPVRLHVGRHRAAPVGRLRQVPLPAVERRASQGSRERERRVGRHRHADGQRRAMDAVRGGDRVRVVGAHPRPGSARALPSRHRQAGRGRSRHHLRDVEGQGAARSREGVRCRRRDRRPDARRDRGSQKGDGRQGRRRFDRLHRRRRDEGALHRARGAQAQGRDRSSSRATR